MNFFTKTLAALSALSALATLHGAMAQTADNYPSKPVRMMVGFPPGQATDLIARKLSNRLSTAFGQNFFVENKPGAGAGLATETVAKADPDGYTILVTSSGPIAVNGWLYKNLRYDTVRDFAPVAFVGIFPEALVVNANSPLRTLQDLITYANKNPGKVSYASGGNGVTNHLVMEMFKHRTGTDMLHVPYKGGMPALTDLMGGQVEAMFETVAITDPFIKQGKLRALAVASEKRFPTLPDVPTLAESGYPGFRGDAWIGVVVPRNVPQPVLNKLTAEINKIIASADWQKEMAESGGRAVAMSPDEFGKFIKDEIAHWGAVVKRANVQLQ